MLLNNENRVTYLTLGYTVLFIFAHLIALLGFKVQIELNFVIKWAYVK